ncbi:MAG: fatty acid desaturase [Deltaproteobacteria bacterium]|nr:fatty acid desaturase [Deltaproteobacteria bacterium]
MARERPQPTTAARRARPRIIAVTHRTAHQVGQAAPARLERSRYALRAPGRGRGPPRPDGGAPRLLHGRHARRPPPGRHQLGILRLRRRPRAHPPLVADDAAARAAHADLGALRALLHRARARSSPAGRDRRRPGDGTLRRAPRPVLPAHGAGAVPERRRLEAKRLGDADMAWWDPRLLRSRVVHGLALGWGTALAILVMLGPGAFAIFLLQALIAIRLLEAVNYFEHWGLERPTRRVRTIDSWDTDSWFTLYTLVGLSRHADHHAHASRPFQQLRYFEESPKLPYGYFGTTLLTLFARKRLRTLLTAELARRRLGPFAPEAAEAS